MGDRRGTTALLVLGTTAVAGLVAAVLADCDPGNSGGHNDGGD
jgi:hypothetical protein